MSFPDIAADLRSTMPALRGRILPNQSLAELTWFRVGGPAQILFMPEDAEDLSYLLGKLPGDIAVTVIGLGSNLVVRDGGIPGVVVRLGRGFGEVAIEGMRVRTGAAVPDVKVARAAQEAGIAGLSFLRGIPGAIGGALRMNGGAYGGETKDVLVEARGVDRRGTLHVYGNADMAFSYRHCGVPDDVIFTQALFQGRPGDVAAIAAEMDKITEFARGDAADQEPHRRFHLQKSAGPKSVAADRCCGLPRLARRRRTGIGDALQFFDQSRHRDRHRHRDARRNGAAAGQSAFRRRAGMGNQADRRTGARGAKLICGKRTGLPSALMFIERDCLD